MIFYFRPLITGLFLLILLFCSSDFNRLAADNYGYNEEHAAWGGNGGWWGGGNNDFYSDRPWRTDDESSYRCSRCNRHYTSCSRCGAPHRPQGRYCSPAYVPPNNEYEYNDTVPGAGLYINLENPR